MLAGKGKGATFLQVTREDIAGLPIELPLLADQRRVAGVLDRADAVRAKRREALTRFDELAKSIFFDMFGGPGEWSARWSIVPFSSVFAIPLRNGTSPSSKGEVAGKVLTLSAITGPGFDPRAVKSAKFRDRLSASDSVCDEDFLICRGNGNLGLVGAGHYPPRSMANVAFPDTVIAARTQPYVIRPHFLEALWRSRFIRSQIESVARTTNGTFKVNQAMIESIAIPVPSLETQSEYETVAMNIEQQRSRCQDQAGGLAFLFESLQARAFRGEL